MTTLPEVPAPVIEVVDVTDQIVALDLEGEFDVAATPEVAGYAEQALRAGKDLIVDLSDVTFIDSSMVHVLFAADVMARENGRRFVLQFGTHAAVERVLEITRTDTALRTASTREAAIALIEAPA